MVPVRAAEMHAVLCMDVWRSLVHVMDIDCGGALADHGGSAPPPALPDHPGPLFFLLRPIKAQFTATSRS